MPTLNFKGKLIKFLDKPMFSQRMRKLLCLNVILIDFAKQQNNYSNLPKQLLYTINENIIFAADRGISSVGSDFYQILI